MTAEPLRPEIHLTAEEGILEAPAAMLRDGSTWHLFHQYRPATGGSPRWGHQFSQGTPYEWEECGDALAADPAFDEVMVRAGSVVACDGGINIYATSVRPDSTAILLARFADLEDLRDSATDVPEDPARLDERVRRVGIVADDSLGAELGLTHLRSPAVVPGRVPGRGPDGSGEASWIMLAVAGPAEAPKLVMLHSDDGASWSMRGLLTAAGRTGLEHEVRVVSPRIIRLRDEIDDQVYDVLLLTVEHEGGREISGYVVGRLIGTTFEVEHPFRRIDFGHDFTRPRNTNYTPGTVEESQRYRRATLVGLLNGGGRGDNPDTHLSLAREGWANAVSIPRVVTLQGGTLFQTPAAGLIDEIAATNSARSWTGLCEIPEGSVLAAELIDSEGSTAAVIRHRGTRLELDRSMNPHHADAPAVAPLAEGDTDSLTILVDGSTVEVFADGGLVAMASRVYIDGGCTDIRVHTEGRARVERSLTQTGGPGAAERLPDWAEEELEGRF